jgi:hypothetical protein
VTESLLSARDAYQDPATGQRIKPGAKLRDAYQAPDLPVAQRRLDQADAAVGAAGGERAAVGGEGYGQ